MNPPAPVIDRAIAEQAAALRAYFARDFAREAANHAVAAALKLRELGDESTADLFDTHAAHFRDLERRKAGEAGIGND
jgi:hypothetical protein